jgi:hypothetical protein
MQINENWRIESDPLNVILQRRVEGKTKAGLPRITWETVGYYATPQRALEDMVRKEILGTGLGNFKKICKKIDDLNILIKSLKIKGESDG